MMDVRKVEKLNTLQRRKCTPDRKGNTEPCKFQYISVITRTPHTSIKSSSELEDEEVVIVAEYHRKAADGTKLAKDSSSVISERQIRKRKRRRSGDINRGLLDNQFWYVECGPEVINLDSSDSESEEDNNRHSEGADSNGNKEDETFVDVHPVNHRFEILEETSYYIPGQKIWRREMGVRIRKPNPNTDPMLWWEGAFKDLHIHLTSSCGVTDYVEITLAVVDSIHAPVSLSYRLIRDYTHEDLFNLIGSPGNCAAAFNMNDTFLITTCVIRGAISRELMGPDHVTVPNRSILTIRSDDMLSLPRSLVVARVYAERGDIRSGDLHKFWNRIRCHSGNHQLTEAWNLVNRVGVKVPNNGYGMRDIEKFQNYLAREGIAIIVYEISSLGQGGGALYNGTGLVKDAVVRVRHTLHVAYYERFRHYQPILNLQIAAGSRGFCAPCNARFTNEVDHACSNRCTQCFGSPPCIIDAREKLICAKCNRCFFGSSCFARHNLARRRDDSICQTISLCSKCWRVIKIRDKRRHDCCATRHYLTRSQESSETANNLHFSA